MFEPTENIFDLYRGDVLPINLNHLTNDKVMGSWTVSMVNASWAPSTRRLYHAWILLWVQFCMLMVVAPLPACTSALARWIVSLSTMYASATVHVAMSAIIGWHALNDLPNPIRSSPMLSRMWTAVRRVNGLGVRKKKALCDHAFVASMYGLWCGMRGMHTAELAFLLTGD